MNRDDKLFCFFLCHSWKGTVYQAYLSNHFVTLFEVIHPSH